MIGNQSRPKIFDLNIRRPPPLYSKVIEVDERVTLVGYTSDPKVEEHAVQFDADGSVTRGYRGTGWDGKSDGEGPGEIVKGLSGEAVRILKRPGVFVFLLLPSQFILVDVLIRHRGPQARSPKVIRRGVSLSRHRSCTLIYLPGPRTHCRLHRALYRLHPCFAIRRASPYDQDGPSGSVLHSRRLPHSYFARIPRWLLQRI